MNKNPNKLCTWDEKSECKKCSDKGKIHCKWSGGVVGGFMAIGFPPFIMTIFLTLVLGLMSGNWWWLIGYLIYVAVIFTLEIRFLCSHCPYYGEEGKTLHCLGNYGAYKLYKYNPAPIGKFGKVMMLFLIITVFFIFPAVASIYSIIYLIAFKYSLIGLMGILGIALGCMMASITFIVILKLYYCSKCINFSCVLNTVSKSEVDTYLKNNEVMRDAWEKSGYKID